MTEIPEFGTQFVRTLRADASEINHPRQVTNAAYTRVRTTSVSNPQMIVVSKEMATELGLEDEFVQSDIFLNAMAGNELLPGMDSFAMNYGGHQFGQWAGQLGDGRAINLGELKGRNESSWMLQLKGAGPTPYSRTADGRAVLRSSIREFLCSEAMFHLGISTTRALSLVSTGDQIERDMFYDGNPVFEPGAVVCRVAPSFIRFGSFQIHAARGETDLLRDLVDYVIVNHYSHLGTPSKDTYLAWLLEISQRTADLVCDWMRVGFVHGVLNTDNMSILGQTIDYGPYGWIDSYDSDWTPNTTDAQSRRYVFGNQARVAHWNVAQLARAMFPLIESPEPLQEILDAFPEYYDGSYHTMMLSKMGLTPKNPNEDKQLIQNLLSLFEDVETDMTIFFRKLSDFDADMGVDALEAAWYGPLSQEEEGRLGSWLAKYWKRLELEGANTEERREQMNRVNPWFVLRNYLAQQAIDLAHDGDYAMIYELMDVMKRPYQEQPEFDRFFARRPEWARHKPGCSMLSCSS